MERAGRVLWRALLAVAAVGATIAWIIASDASPTALVGSALVLLATGAIVERAWTALLPMVGPIVVLVLNAVDPPQNEHHENGWVVVVILALIFAIGASLCLLLGAGLRRMLETRGREARTA